MDCVKRSFANGLIDSLKRFYGGRIPAMATIARDFSFQSPHLPHVSGETVRKWIRGDTLPHVSRMQVLIDWLGPQLADPFEKPANALKIIQAKQSVPDNSLNNGNGHDQHAHDALTAVISLLSEKECETFLMMARLFLDKVVEQDANDQVALNLRVPLLAAKGDA